MRMVARIAMVLAAAAFAAWGVQRFVYEPYACNRIVTDLTRRTALAYDTGDHYRRIARARANLQGLNAFRERCPLDVRGYTLTASNEEILGRYADAVRTYRQAFAVEQRPELHTAIGDALIQLGRADEAVDSYVEAARFNAQIIDSIRAEEIKRRVRERMSGRR